MHPKEALDRLLHAIEETAQLDADVADYLHSVLDPQNRDDSTLDVVQELLSGASKAFERLHSERQNVLLIQLLEQVEDDDQRQEPPDTSSFAEQDVLAAALKQLRIPTQQSGHSQDLPGSSASTQSSHDSSLRDHDVQALANLCQDAVGCQFLLSILEERCSGNMQAAADWVLDCPDIIAAEQEWQEEQVQQQQARQQAMYEEKRQKKKLVERFDLMKVPDAAPSSKKAARALEAWPATKDKQHQAASKVRYRDGVVVTSKGDKYIIEKVKEDWDGGSKGKVYTKGKRGKGFV